MTDSMVKQVTCNNLNVNWSNIDSTGKEILKHLIPSDTESLIISRLNNNNNNNDDSILNVLSILINNNINRLFEVNLSWNKIKTLGHRSHNLFINNFNNQHLIYLNISHNFIKFITSDTFHSLKRLKSLDLSYNGIKYIDERAFHGLDSLQSLHLQHNSISIIYLDLFQSLLNVRVSFIQLLTSLSLSLYTQSYLFCLLLLLLFLMCLFIHSLTVSLSLQ